MEVDVMKNSLIHPWREENFKEDNTRLQEIISEQNIVITHLRRENAGLKDRIRSFNVKNTNRKIKKQTEKIKKLENIIKK